MHGITLYLALAFAGALCVIALNTIVEAMAGAGETGAIQSALDFTPILIIALGAMALIGGILAAAYRLLGR